MRPYRALFLVVVIFSALIGGIAVQAQEAIPETPPELRDFRLDPERSQPQPTPQPTVTLPPVVSTVPETATEATSAQPQPAPRQATAQQPVTSAAPETTEQQPEVTLPTVEQAQPVTLPETAPVIAGPEPEAVAWNYSLVGGAGAAILLGLLGLWFALKRRRRRHEELASEEPAIEPEAPKPAQPVIPKPMPASKPKPIKAPDLTSDVALAFVPEKATISFTTLTVKGQLQIANESQSLAQDMQFRAGLISASNQQQLAMQAFFGDSDIAASALGEARPGEKLAMSIELTVPLTEMQSFPLGDQRLLVPIMVAELAYKDEKGTDRQVRIASMLGREAKPPQPKMGPLRLDQGPRSFAPLGQRPLAA
jgi:hypothetical protein